MLSHSREYFPWKDLVAKDASKGTVIADFAALERKLPNLLGRKDGNARQKYPAFY